MIGFAIFWLVSGVLCHGYLFAYLQLKYPTLAKRDYKGDIIISIVLGLLLGPVGLVLVNRTYGFKLF